MCGVVVLWDPDRSEAELAAAARAMRDALEHRGPDDAGLWYDAPSGIALGHRRLSIVELSRAGHQPMASPSGRYVIAFNGEVYNHLELRPELGDVAFRGTSDTETMLAAIERWGLEGAVRRFVGMFAFALWDREERALHLVRDRVGIKPMYVGHAGRALLSASELDAIASYGAFDRAIDQAALAEYFALSCVEAPRTIYRRARKQRPGTIWTYSSPDEAPRETVYWDAEEVARRGQSRPFRGTEADAVDAVEAALRDAIRLRLIADVPVGAFLSGGIDSSLVVAIAQSLRGTSGIRTFTIGSEDTQYDESAQARRIAAQLGTRHTSLRVSASDALAVVHELPRIHDEPFADSSQIPAVLVSRLARQQVTVALSGDGGDEIFGGYNRYRWAPRILRGLEGVPRPLRRKLGRLLARTPQARWDAIAAIAPGVRVPLLGDKVHKLAHALDAADGDAAYEALRTVWHESPFVGAARPAPGPPAAGLSMPERMMLADVRRYLVDDILVKVDRASMSVALEARVPILDHRVIELAASLPLSIKLRGGGKWVLREVLARHLPRAAFEGRPKTGFSVPIGAWLRGPLRPWAEDLLSAHRLTENGLDPGAIRSRWQGHLAGRAEHGHALWSVLVFQAWARERSGARGRRAAVVPTLETAS